eukprot:183988-Amphidinium_carterae.1
MFRTFASAQASCGTVEQFVSRRINVQVKSHSGIMAKPLARVGNVEHARQQISTQLLTRNTISTIVSKSFALQIALRSSCCANECTDDTDIKHQEEIELLYHMAGLLQGIALNHILPCKGLCGGLSEALSLLLTFTGICMKTVAAQLRVYIHDLSFPDLTVEF